MDKLEDQATHSPAEDKNVAGAPAAGRQQQGQSGERQQGDQDLGADSKSSPDSQGMK